MTPPILKSACIQYFTFSFCRISKSKPFSITLLMRYQKWNTGCRHISDAGRPESPRYSIKLENLKLFYVYFIQILPNWVSVRSMYGFLQIRDGYSYPVFHFSPFVVSLSQTRSASPPYMTTKSEILDADNPPMLNILEIASIQLVKFCKKDGL